MNVVEKMLERIEVMETRMDREQSESSATQSRTTPNAGGNSQKTSDRINAAQIQMNGATLQNGRQTEPD
jgi:hypothetical protein